MLTWCYRQMKGIEYLYILLLLDFNSTMQARVAHESSDIKKISLVSWRKLQKLCNLDNTLQFTVDIKYMNLSCADLQL